MKPVIALLLFGLATPAFADAVASFRDGRFLAAAQQGRAEATAESLEIAGRATLTIACYETRDRARALELLSVADRDFDAALAKEPTNLRARMQKALALGYRAKLTKSPGLARETRRTFEALRAANPNYAIAAAAIGGWHGGSIATLGSFLAGTVLGAKANAVDPAFQAAMRLEPTSPVHRVFYAHVLLDLDRNNAPKATQLLTGIDRLPTHDGFEALLKAQGIALLATLRAGDARAAQALARRQQPFGTIG
ncbi:hypothetical protein IP88_03555 [alpha proteobacterium AAP81b]|nr:hypothetical protein IP88_03555 [alpha proteobacterium AAP81b]